MNRIIFALCACMIFAPCTAYAEDSQPFVSQANTNVAFKQERRVFLWDVTLSMKGKTQNDNNTPNIWDEVKNALIKSISSITDPTTEIVVIPFQDKPLDVWTATAQDCNALISKIEAFDTDAMTYTDIVGPMRKAMSLMTPDRRNVLTLLTDGGQSSTDGSKAKKIPTKQDLLDLINEWCAFAETNDAYGLYILLTDNASKENIDIANAIKQSCRMTVSHGTNINFTELQIENATVNIKDEGDQNLRLSLSATKDAVLSKDGASVPLQDVRLHISASNRFFSVDTDVAPTGIIDVPIRWAASDDALRNMIPLNEDETVELTVTVANAPQYPYAVLLSEKVKVRLINKAEKRLSIYVK